MKDQIKNIIHLISFQLPIYSPSLLLYIQFLHQFTLVNKVYQSEQTYFQQFTNNKNKLSLSSTPQTHSPTTMRTYLQKALFCGKTNSKQVFLIIISQQYMQKTKQISSKFPSYKESRTREQKDQNEDEQSISNRFINQQQADISFPLNQSYYPFKDATYSIEEFIQNLQSEQFIYYSDSYLEELDSTVSPQPRGPTIDQINRDFLEKIGEIGGEANEGCKIAFSSELVVKYFNPNDAPNQVKIYSQYSYELEEGREGRDQL